MTSIQMFGRPGGASGAGDALLRCAKIEVMREESRRLGLAGRELLDDLETALKNCNGIGAEWFPDWARRLTTALHPSLEAAACIHDLRYGRGGTARDRWSADLEFLGNAFRSAARRRGLGTTRRLAVVFQGTLFFVLLRAFGAPAYAYRGGKR